MNKSESIASISKALSQLQLEVTNPANTMVNPFYKSKYAPLPDVLNVVRPLLGKFGLAVIQNTHNEEDKVFINTLVTHESGEWIETDALVLKPEKNTPQGIGSAITYGRRYQLSAVIGVASEEDDDGNVNEKDKLSKSKKEEVNVELEELKKSIIEVAGKISAKSAEDRKAVTATIKELNPAKNSNPNSLTDVETAKKILNTLNNMMEGK